MYNEEALKYKEQFKTNKLDYLPHKDSIKKHIDTLIDNTNKLDVILKDISEYLREQRNNLVVTENY